MPWVRIDDQFPSHPKVVGVGPLGIALQVAALCYASRYLTDGHIPRAAVPTLIDFSELDEHAFNGRGGVCWIAAQRLVDNGLWEEVKDGFLIHDYLEYQPSRESVMHEREAARDRMQRVRANIERTSPEVQEEFALPRSRSRSRSRSQSPTRTPTPDPTNTLAWLETLRGIEGWTQKGEPHVTALLKWATDKGWSNDQLERTAIGLAGVQSKTLKGYGDMASAFQRRLNQGYDLGSNGRTPPGSGESPPESGEHVETTTEAAKRTRRRLNAP